MAEIWLKMALKRQLVSLLIYGTPSIMNSWQNVFEKTDHLCPFDWRGKRLKTDDTKIADLFKKNSVFSH